jgi:hypothetical protein
MIRMRSNWGGNYVELGDVKLYVTGKQTGTAPVVPSQEKVIASNRNKASVKNGPTRFSTFTLTQRTIIVSINTYHWNNGEGTPSPGKIGIKGKGSWQATGSPGMYDTPNAEWLAKPMIVLAPGTYTITDSDAGSWSHNGQSKGIGFFEVVGVEIGGR